MTEPKMFGCVFLSEEKTVIVYQDSYINEEAKKDLENQGWKIMRKERRSRYGSYAGIPIRV